MLHSFLCHCLFCDTQTCKSVCPSLHINTQKDSNVLIDILIPTFQYLLESSALIAALPISIIKKAVGSRGYCGTLSGSERCPKEQEGFLAFNHSTAEGNKCSQGYTNQYPFNYYLIIEHSCLKLTNQITDSCQKLDGSVSLWMDGLCLK